MPSDTHWRDRAACRTVDTNTMYPHEGGHTPTTTAKAICARCPVQNDCLQYALTHHDPWGIWGGLTGDERRRHTAGHPIRHCTRCAQPYVAAGSGRCPACRTNHPETSHTPGKLDGHRDDIETRAHAGWSDRQIADLLGCTKESICKARNRWNIPPGVKQRPGANPDLKPCGTEAAHRRHRRRGEPVDEACRQAHAARRRVHQPAAA